MDYNSPISRLKSAIFQYRCNCRIFEFFDVVDVNDFVIWSASKYLVKNTVVKPNCHCKDISKEKMKCFMEKQYENSPTIQLQAHLITLGSEVAVFDTL